MEFGRTYIKTLLRAIRSSLGRFIAIFGIVALGVGFLAGLWVTTPDMKLSVDAYYDDADVMDVFVKSPALFSDDDIAKIKALPEVQSVQGAFVSDAVLQLPTGETIVSRIYGKNGYFADENSLNRLELIEGRLPRNTGECIVEKSGGYLQTISIGETLTFSPDNADFGILDYVYSSKEYKVVGIVKSPLYFSQEYEPSTVGNGRLSAVVYVNEDVFLIPQYTDLFVALKNAKDYDTFSDDYTEFVKDAKQKIKNLHHNAVDGTAITDWYVLTREEIVSFVAYKANIEKIADVATVFPIFFLLVASLVALTTMTRMVEEERGQIGTLKALGYRKRTIAFKYLTYCGITSIAGCFAGMAVGFKLLPLVFYTAFGTMYALPPFISQFNRTFAGIASALILVCTLGATLGASYSSLRENVSSLLHARAPKSGKRIFLEYLPFWRFMNFSQKATARNLLRYKKHFFMTVTGIAGCTALVLVGFALRDSVKDIAFTQFEDISTYDLRIDLRGNADEAIGGFFDHRKDFITFTRDRAVAVNIQQGSVTSAHYEGEKISTAMYIPESALKLNSAINFRELKTGKRIVFNQRSVIITQKMGEELNIEKNGFIEVENADGKTARVQVTDFMENYVGNYLYMSPEKYAEAFPETAPESLQNALRFSSILVSTGFTDREKKDELMEGILASAEVASAELTSQLQESYTNLLTSIEFLVFVLILAAGALAMIVIYNLTNININERTRELATLRVLGYYKKEVCTYIFREITILSIIGGIAGLLVGIPLFSFIISVAENTNLMFGRSIKIESFVFSFIITGIFTIFVELVMRKKIKDIPMADSIKSID
ncbi:MAG: hypothetical protein Ta2A_03090 [Treponemataceae bacterium]|nr:MAG: hypothetical protein Ta2A_03090 [Treponemataceae bacterium]